ncbi:thiamine ABC transporter permease [Lachnospiraceae bacterium]|uniref:ABC transporter ATP-binding protein n=1 Tax=Extibacter sp. GGCC_0201 TaxID=2731209 RepID=UPI001AA17586|nr:ABC transporter ATP-binding protein [Extibacter sp. GGCC_0201]MBO1721199.1 ABC transporter ATP-binding protein [Extibacter sp. GGCC_0201]BDF34808.1 thiamine ABC transporter permease [Lachnospiraceae bacterium]BDF38809.1 thiamine ABC transporter permease [Lachnospiraceae bacterium]
MKEKLKKLIAYYKPYKLLFYSDLFFAVLGAGVTLVIPLIVRYITNQVVYYEPPEARQAILMLGAVMIALVLLEFGCNYYIAYFGHMMGARMEADMRSDIFGHYQKLTFAFYDNQKVGHLLSRITSDLFDISELLHHGPEDVLISVIKIAGSFIILVNVNARLTIVAFAFVPAMLLFAVYYNKKMKRAFSRNRAKIADINSQIEDSLAGIRVVKSFANEKEEMKKFNQGNNNFVEAKKTSYLYMGMYHSGLNALTTLVTVGVLVAGGSYLTAGSVNVSDLITFLLYINNFTEPVKKLVNSAEQFQNGYTGFERFLEILSIAPDIADKADAVHVDKLKGEITFQDVSFHYEDNEEKVLNHINLKAEAGDYIALVGPSGVGKTTLCSLIPRFYDVSSGRILADGTDIRDICLSDLRNNIGIVQQDVYLFAGTIMDNIRYGRPEATDEDVVRAAKNANAHAFIMSFPEGYDTDIGQRGVKLSGGQKQRLSIARVFLKNPPILIFDEATSALDNESEKVVQQSLEGLAKDRTTFVIAHRLTTIQNAQRILVLTEEGIAEQGTHEELLAKQGIYEALYYSGRHRQRRADG